MPRPTKDIALQKIEKLEKSIERIERILIGCAGALLIGMGGVITALIFRF